jgi:hypothetical protein
MIGIPFTIMLEAALLVALGLGYIVIYLARREEKALKALGYTIGSVMIILSSIFIISSLVFGTQIYRKIGRMMLQRRMMMQMPQPSMPNQK